MKSTSRANFLPERRFLPLLPALQEHLIKVGHAITPENFLSICDDVLLRLLDETFERVAADEGAIWLLDQEKNFLWLFTIAGRIPTRSLVSNIH